MKKKRKSTLNESDFERAWAIYSGVGFCHLDHRGCYFSDNTECRMDNDDRSIAIQLQSDIPTPEKILLRKESVQLLSEEAREVIEMVLSAPMETIAALSTPTGLLTKRSIQLGLQKLWKSKFIAKLVIEEITKWANQL